MAYIHILSSSIVLRSNSFDSLKNNVLLKEYYYVLGLLCIQLFVKCDRCDPLHEGNANVYNMWML